MVMVITRSSISIAWMWIPLFSQAILKSGTPADNWWHPWEDEDITNTSSCVTCTTIIFIIIIIVIIILGEAIQKKCSGPRADIEDLTSKIQPVAIDNKYVIKSFRADNHSIRKDIHFRDPSWDGRVRAQDVAKRQPAWQRKCLWQSQPSQTNNIPTSTHILLLWTSSYITMITMIFITTSTPDGSCDQQHSNTHVHPLTSWSQVGDI